MPLCVHIERLGKMIFIYFKNMAFVLLKNRWIAIILSLFSFTLVNISDASVVPLNSDKKIVSIQYLAPTEESRDIKTINIDFNYLLTQVKKVSLSIYLGLTATYATGSITQLEGSIEAGTLREAHYDNSAFGLAPGLLASFQLWSRNNFSIHLNGSGSFVVYNKEFPAGGDFYNFMWRVGPSLEYDIGKSKVLGIGYQWAHISNGQGVGPQNPSYNAWGIILRFTGFL
jgi:hypothetical protein